MLNQQDEEAFIMNTDLKARKRSEEGRNGLELLVAIAEVAWESPRSLFMFRVPQGNAERFLPFRIQGRRL